MPAGEDSLAIAPLSTGSHDPACPFPRFVSSSEGGGGGRPWEDESLRPLLDARKPSAASDGKDRLSTLPLDVLLLIFESASPGALLALVRTTKAFRRLLLARSPRTERLWAGARRNVGWPELGAPLDEPEYAHLVEGWDCQLCGSTSDLIVEYALRVRLCKTCDEQNIADTATIRQQNPSLHLSGWPGRKEELLDQELAAMGFKPEDYTDIPHTAWWTDDWWHPLPDPPERERASVDGASDTDSDLDEEWDLAQFERDWMSSLLEDFFECPEDNPFDLEEPADWDAVKPFIVDYAECCRRVRLCREQAIYRADRKEQIRPLYDQVRALLDSSRRRVYPNLVDFALLPSVKPLWFPDNVVVTPSSWPALYPSILVDALREIRTLKIRLFDRVARTFPSLPPYIRLTLLSELVDPDPARAPLHALLSDSDMDPLFARATALFRCGQCARKLVYPDIVEHLRDAHGAGSAQCAAWACFPREEFGHAVRGMLAAAGLEEETSDESLRRMGRVSAVWERCANGTVRETRESWDELTSGKSAERLNATVGKLSFSPDRDIFKIRLERGERGDACALL
ncbi:hypothetical protein JCM10449v2_005948 [Rhodotorula kratochvilovae]